MRAVHEFMLLDDTGKEKIATVNDLLQVAARIFPLEEGIDTMLAQVSSKLGDLSKNEMFGSLQAAMKVQEAADLEEDAPFDALLHTLSSLKTMALPEAGAAVISDFVAKFFAKVLHAVATGKQPPIQKALARVRGLQDLINKLAGDPAQKGLECSRTAMDAYLMLAQAMQKVGVIVVPVSSVDLRVKPTEQEITTDEAQQEQEEAQPAEKTEKTPASVEDLSVAWHAAEWLKTCSKKEVFAGDFYIEAIAWCTGRIKVEVAKHFEKLKAEAAPLMAQATLDKYGRPAAAQPPLKSPESMWFSDFTGDTWAEFEKHAADTLLACNLEAVKGNWVRLRGLWCDWHAMSLSFAMHLEWAEGKELIDEVQKVVWAADLMQLYCDKDAKPAAMRTKSKTIKDEMQAKEMQADALGIWLAKRMKAAMKLQKL